MATRQIVSYDDITLPYESSTDRQTGRPPPAKKRKKNNQKPKRGDSPRQPSHVGEPSTSKVTEPRNRETSDLDDRYEESRELTHDEIWDDSALVGAWEAAQQEYEMSHGTSKNWKNEPVKNSPLWYNVPIEQTLQRTNGVPTAVAQSENIEPAEPDSQPLNFDTFVPTHDPSLHIPAVDPQNYALGGSMVSQDDAFSRAMTAMYWGGYWTAMYYCQRHFSAHDIGENGVDEAEAEGETDEES